ncbi:hypothetical protein C0J52_23750 [Blattella germanica]|nr:hypothetical protein C0J52_23750 [Blattella germanica]
MLTLYFGFYFQLALIMRGRVPTQKDLKRTLMGIIISTMFLGSNAFTFSLFNCWIRVYATETVFRMAAWRGLVRPIPYGQVLIFAISMTVISYFYRAPKGKQDSMFGLLRFVVGPYEGSESVQNLEQSAVGKVAPSTSKRLSGSRLRSMTYLAVSAVCKAYYKFIKLIQGLGKHPTCPHPYSCIYYFGQSTVKLFSMGYGLQVILKALMQMRRLIRKPSMLPKILVHKNAFQLGAFFGAFSGIFKLTSCLLRWIRSKDSKYHAIPAGFLAGLAFGFYPDNTVALYVMWKSLQIIYNDTQQKGYAPELPGAVILLYCFSTAILFHAAVLEPQNLRPSYWKFLQSLSGGRISAMDRRCLDAFGLGTSKALEEVLVKTRTHLVPFSELL